MRILAFCLAVYLAFSFLIVSAQAPIVSVELGAPVYSTVERSGGARWVVRGRVYPAGSYSTGVPLCAEPDGVKPIGTYAIFGEVGDAARHDARYVISLADRRVFVFGGVVESVDELGAPAVSTLAAARLINGQPVMESPALQAAYTPRSAQCFGGALAIGPETEN